MMKHLLLPSLFFICFFSLAQNSWIQRLKNSDDNYANTDSLTGIRDIQLCKDGSLLLLAYLDQNNREAVIKIPDTGSPLEWSVVAGQHFGMSGHHTRNIFPTADSGFIAGEQYWDNSPQSIGNVKKYAKDGTLVWSQQFYGMPPFYDEIIFDVSQNNAGNYYALIGDNVGDTLYEFDNSGNISSQFTTIKGFRFFEMPNADLIVQTFDSLLERRSLSGTLYWSIPCLHILATTPSYSIIQSLSGIQKIDNATGLVSWTKNYPFGISSAVFTPDGGFLGVSGVVPSGVTEFNSMQWTWTSQLPGTLCRMDSMGDTLWTKHFSFPYNGLTSVLQLPSGDIVTGGAFIFTSSDYLMFQRDYSAFVAKLDSSGNGLLETTSYIWPGDANNNMISGFVDDGLFTSIAAGATGPARDTLDPSTNAWRSGFLSDYAANWTDTFSNGVNYKHADFNGDGLIDTNDVALYSFGAYGFSQPITIQAWRLTNPFSYSSTLPDFKLIPERDTVAPGDLIRLYITVGGNVPADTLYGLAFSLDYSNLLVDTVVNAIIYNSDLGSVGNDLYPFHFAGNNFAGWRNINVMACRNNHQNVFNLNDTIGEITMTALENITSVETVQVSPSAFNALTFYQTSVPFNLVGASVVIDPLLLNVSNGKNESPVLYPNPASEKLFISNLQNKDASLQIFNSLGEKIRDFSSVNLRKEISIADLPNGIYTLRILSGNSDFNSHFIIRH